MVEFQFVTHSLRAPISLHSPSGSSQGEGRRRRRLPSEEQHEGAKEDGTVAKSPLSRCKSLD